MPLLFAHFNKRKTISGKRRGNNRLRIYIPFNRENLCIFSRVSAATLSAQHEVSITTKIYSLK